MTTNTQPTPWSGFPPDLRPGPHWLQEKRQWDTGATPGPTFLAEWSTLTERWSYFGVSGSDDAVSMAQRCDYLAPCAPPDEVAELRTDLSNARAWLQDVYATP